MSDTSYTYRVKVGDLESPFEYSSKAKAEGFAAGARFVLDNIRYYESTKVTVTTYEHSYNENTDVETVVDTREF